MFLKTDKSPLQVRVCVLSLLCSCDPTFQCFRTSHVLGRGMQHGSALLFSGPQWGMKRVREKENGRGREQELQTKREHACTCQSFSHHPPGPPTAGRYCSLLGMMVVFFHSVCPPPIQNVPTVRRPFITVHLMPLAGSTSHLRPKSHLLYGEDTAAVPPLN